MRKTYPLTAPNKQPARVLDAVKHDIRRYITRERGRPLPSDQQTWQFDCKVGADAASAQALRVSEVIAAVDAVAASGAASVYVEILTRAAERAPRPQRASDVRDPQADDGQD